MTNENKYVNAIETLQTKIKMMEEELANIQKWSKPRSEVGFWEQENRAIIAEHREAITALQMMASRGE